MAITVTETAGVGYISVGRCATLEGIDRPATSNLNHGPGQTTTNLAIVDLDDGEMCIFTKQAAHIVIDLQAELVADQQVGLIPVTPERPHDSRKPRS